MKIFFNNFANNINPLTFKGEKLNQTKNVGIGLPQDVFEKNGQVEDKCIQKLNALFPNGGLEKIYAQMGKELGLDVLPKLKFYGVSDGVAAGGFTFNKNMISLSLQDIFDNNQKVVMVKNGMYKVLTSPTEKLPLFIDKVNGEKFVNGQKEQFKKFVDDLKFIPVTDDDFRKFIVQKLYHELVHAQQHMIMRYTEGIGEKEIIKAWTHLVPESEHDETMLNHLVDIQFNSSFWAKSTPLDVKFDKESDIGKRAYVWLESIRTYPPVDSSEYKTNAIEVDAYNRSYDYIVKNFGGY